MGVLNYSLVSLITILALPIGAYLAKLAEEELKPGKKYIQLLFPTAIAFTLLLTALTFEKYLAIIIILTALAIVYFRNINNYIIYTAIAILFIINKEYFLPVASILFVANLAKGTELYKDKHTITKLAIFFLIIANLPLLFVNL